MEHKICSHLEVIYQYLVEHKNAKIVKVDEPDDRSYICFHLDCFLHWSELKTMPIPADWDVMTEGYLVPGGKLTKIYLRGIKKVSRILRWGYADPHEGNGNGIGCWECHCSLEAKFDSSDPKNTMGD